MPSASEPPSASIVVPTRARLDYLRVALASIAPQASAAGAEVVVVDDAGDSEQARRLASRFGARYEPHPGPLGLNVARNTGVARTEGELVVFVDDDVEVCDGWLDALLRAAREHPQVDVFTGPIQPRLEGSPPRSCGRERAPITSLDLGPDDARTRFAWGANMTIRRTALDRVGPFDVSLEHGGDEQEWQERLARETRHHTLETSHTPDEPRSSEHGIDPPTETESGQEPVLYVATASLRHRRSPADAHLRPLCRAAYARGRAARRFDVWRGQAPSRGHELHTLAACLGHVFRHRCPAGLTMVAHSGGRLLEALRTDGRSERSLNSPAESTERISRGPIGATPSDDFLSGESGHVGGVDGLRRACLDLGADALEILSGRTRRLARAAQLEPPTRKVLVLGIERPQHRKLVGAIRAELARSRHEVEIHFAPAEELGKFENLNLLLGAHRPEDRDWLLVVDDDIVLPKGFLDGFLFLAEHFALDLAQPAHRLASHAAWQVTRRRSGDVVRETRFVEIGPLTAFARSTFSTLLPFPDLRMGWGLDLHWAALARDQGWRCGVVDATPIAHRAAPAASTYSREQALDEARAFLSGRPYLKASEARQTLVTHRHW
ncbi:MAG: glycosyltransferase [Solirubrobacteraceae bacterium]